MYRVLFITDDWANKRSLKSTLLERRFTPVPVTSAEVFADAFAPEKIQVVIVDLERCATDRAKLCHALKRERALKDLPLVLLLRGDLLAVRRPGE